MKRGLLLAGLGLGLLIALFAIGSCLVPVTPQQLQLEKLKDLAGPLPASLDNLYPPKAPAPVFLFEMFNLEAPAVGILVDLQEGDIPGVQANYKAFVEQYNKLSDMVPEWKGLFPKEPVEALGAALASGDPGRVGAAFEEVGKVCGTCHLVNQAKAFQKYHWPDFEGIELTNPLTREKVGWVDYMFAMSGAIGGVSNDLQQGQLDNARRNFQAFSALFKALDQSGTGCRTEGCHDKPDEPRKYFVDASVLAMVDQLGQALQAPRPDPAAIGELMGAIGGESCGKCHLVHIPAQQAKERWEVFADLFK